MSHFHHGINLGGWLSQCETRQTREHYETFMRQSDIQRIAEWGFDHVRLPVDSTVLCDKSGTLKTEILTYLHNCLEWCEHSGLGLQLDMHRLPGYNIATPSENTLFGNEKQLETACQIWTGLAKEFISTGNHLRFELLNEPEWSNGYEIQNMFQRIIHEIRKYDSDRVLIISGNHYDHVDGMEGIRIPEDPGIICTFHYYEPNLYTNQLYGVARGINGAYGESPEYPGGFPLLREYLDAHPEGAETSAKYCWIRNDRRLMEKNFRKALDFRKFTGQEIYLGEFGVCYHAEEGRRISWTRDLLDICRRNSIDWCYWTYKEMDYGLVDIHGRTISANLLKLLQEHIF